MCYLKRKLLLPAGNDVYFGFRNERWTRFKCAFLLNCRNIRFDRGYRINVKSKEFTKSLDMPLNFGGTIDVC